MEILNYKKTEIQNSYVDFKASMDAVVERVEEGFVQIGYYLKIARDTQVLQESGYKSVTDLPPQNMVWTSRRYPDLLRSMTDSQKTAIQTD